MIVGRKALKRFYALFVGIVATLIALIIIVLCIVYNIIIPTECLLPPEDGCSGT